MARPRFAHLDEGRREALIAAAGTEFARHGFTAASLNRILARAGLSKGAFYYYFDDKADLLATVVDAAMERALGAIAWPDLAELTAATFWDRLLAVTRSSAQLLDADAWYVAVLRAFHRLREEPGAAAATAGVLDRGRALVTALLARGRELGVVRADLPLDLLVEMHVAADTAGDAWTMRHWTDLDEAGRVALLDARMDLVRDMLDARGVGWDR